MDVKLIILTGSQEGREIPITVERFVIGRSSSSNLRAASDQISRHHCAISVSTSSVQVEDLGSKNGVQVNDKQIEGVRELQSGDRLTVGPLKFEVVAEHRLTGKKKPPVKGIAEAASRTVEAAQGGSLEDSIADWVDFAGFNVRWLHRELGLNVAIPVLPFHGPRKTGRRGGDGFLTGDLLDTIHAQAQAVWDVRRLIGWLERAGAPAVGLYGLSLGGYTVGLVAGLEPDLDCVIAGVPASDWVTLVTSHAPPGLLRASERLGFPWSDVKKILRVVSPLAIDLAVPRERCFLFAGTADRLAPPEQALVLWRHWGRPRLAWYNGSHVSFLVEPEVKNLVREALHATRLVAQSE